MTTDNYRKHTTSSSLQRFFIERFFKALLGELRALRPTSILDVGCGEGFTLEWLRVAGIGERLEGIDFLQRAVDIGSEIHPQLALKQGSIYELPYEDGAFDTVLCCEVLEHLEDPAAALKELERVTRRNLVVSVPHEPWFQLANLLRGKNLSRAGNDIEHIQHFSARGIMRFVGARFKVVRWRIPFPWTIVIAQKQ